MGFKGCRAAALFGEGDQGVLVSAAATELPALGGLLDVVAAHVTAEMLSPSIAHEVVVAIPPIDA